MFLLMNAFSLKIQRYGQVFGMPGFFTQLSGFIGGFSRSTQIALPQTAGKAIFAVPTIYNCRPILRSSDQGPPPRNATASMIRPHISGYS